MYEREGIQNEDRISDRCTHKCLAGQLSGVGRLRQKSGEERSAMAAYYAICTVHKVYINQLYRMAALPFVSHRRRYRDL